MDVGEELKKEKCRMLKDDGSWTLEQLREAHDQDYKEMRLLP